MRRMLYCASMIAITCASASARPHASTPPRIVCDDRGCASAAGAGAPSLAVASRRVAVSRRGYTRTSIVRTYAPRGRAIEAERPQWQPQERVASPSVQRPAFAHGGGGGVVTIATAANPITVASTIAGPMRDLVADLVAHGFRGSVACQASGHMPHSLHHTGEACDFAQLSRNVVAPGAAIMYHASDIIAAHGLRDGCSFHDCGHVDSGRMTSARAQWIPEFGRARRYSRRYLGHGGYRVARRYR
jgi:hypothetical protein